MLLNTCLNTCARSQDGLRISSATCFWKLFSDTVRLPRIIEACIGAGLRNRLHSLTVMSKGKGTPYTQQSYKTCDSFPYDWIVEKVSSAADHPEKRMPDRRPPLDNASQRSSNHARCADGVLGHPLQWAEGYHVTSAGTSCSSWAIVMSKGAPILRQVHRVS